MARSTRKGRGLFISFEGVEGSGKSTQLSRLAERLRSQGWTVLETREPGGTTVAEQIRDVLLSRGNERLTALTETFLVMAARCQHVAEVIRPALAAGAIVICDRFADSTLAYQGYGRGIPIPSLRRLNELATAGLQPDLTILFDVPVAVGLLRRRAHREVNRLDMESSAFHERVRAGFLRLARSNAKRVKVIAGDESPAVVSDMVYELIQKRLRRPPTGRRRRRSGPGSVVRS